MKIAILADPLDNQNAGVHVYTREMIRSMIENNVMHDIILIRQNYDPDLTSVRQIIVPARSFPPGATSFRLFSTIPRLLRKEKVDVVIEPAHFGPFNLPETIKRVTIIHDLTPILFPHLHRWHSQILQRIFLQRILKKADLIVGNSENTKNDILNTYPSLIGKTIMIYPGMSQDISPQEIDLFKTYGIRQPYFLTVGTIEPRKNHLLLLKAYTLFRTQSNASHQWVITGGKGWKSESFYKALDQNPFKQDIILTGFVPDNHLPILNEKAVAMIYPSKYEGFGLPVLEAIVWGTIPVTSANSSLTEVGGPHTFYFFEENEEELSDLLLQVSVLPPSEREDIIKHLQIHGEKFSWDRFGKQLFHALEKLGSSENT